MLEEKRRAKILANLSVPKVGARDRELPPPRLSAERVAFTRYEPGRRYR